MASSSKFNSIQFQDDDDDDDDEGDIASCSKDYDDDDNFVSSIYSKYDYSTDPYSENYNPLMALYSDDEPENDGDVDDGIKVFNNIAEFENFVSGKSSVARRKQDEGAGNTRKSFSKKKLQEVEAANRDVEKLRNMMKDRHKENTESKQKKVCKEARRLENVFTSMQELCLGPSEVISRAMSNRSACRVYTRHMCGLRGILVGYIAAFDCHMNLAMTDVHEVYSHSPIGEVQHHQKKLTIAILDEAFRKTKVVPKESKATIKKPAVKTKDDQTFRMLPPPPTVKKPKECKTMKFPGLTKFKGGLPTLFHRHLDSIYVRGDNIVIVRLFHQL